MSDQAPSLRFHNKIAIVTGGCDGVGRGCVDVLAENGGTVVVFDINDEMGSELASEGPGKIIFIHCDVTKESEIRESIEQTVKLCGRIDCLVNNVGTHPSTMTIDEISVQSFQDLLEINLVSNFTASKYALPFLRESKGCIVNISSTAASAGIRYSSSYSASKGGVLALTRAMAIDETKYGHMNRFAHPREIGLTCLYLVVDATFMTGEEVMCTGGAEIGYGIKGGGAFV